MDTETYTLAAYGVYLVAVAATTFAVARMIFRHGRVFLLKGYAGEEAPAAATGALLRTQFHLVAISAMLLLLRLARAGESTFLSATRPKTGSELFEALSVKIGLMLLIIGALHFVTLRLINRVRASGTIF